MSVLRFSIFGLSIGAAAMAIGWGVGRWRAAPPTPASVDRGAMLFQVHCASCHGSDGRGDGVTTLNPPPRDFAARPWRFEPTRDSIRRVTVEGIPQSAMPAFDKSLSPDDVDAVVAHVERLANSATPSDDAVVLRAAGFTSLRGAAPPLTVVDAKGKSLDVSKLRGQLVLLHFWGTSCIHCIKEIPALDELEKSHAGTLKVIHVCASDDDAPTAQEHLDRMAPGARAFAEPQGFGLARFEVQSLPTIWLIDADGKAIARSSGAMDWKSPEMTRVLQRYLPPRRVGRAERSPLLRNARNQLPSPPVLWGRGVGGEGE